MEKNKKFKFASYYKYGFSFIADDGQTFHGGGNSDDIYRAEIRAEMTAEELENTLEGSFREPTNLST